MSSEAAKLSSLSAGVDDLITRSAELASHLEDSSHGEAAAALFEAERSLAMASRAMDRARRALDETGF